MNRKVLCEMIDTVNLGKQGPPAKCRLDFKNVLTLLKTLSSFQLLKYYSHGLEVKLSYITFEAFPDEIKVSSLASIVFDIF